MSDPQRIFEVRCPIHGFIPFNDWERTVIAHPAFQRLRRIRQLAWTEFVYPGATHTRFEHSLGVMHLANRMYQTLVERHAGILKREFAYDDAGLARDRQLVRFAALLHDVGHGPLSHASEDLFPPDGATGKPFEHEQYSAAIVRHCLRNTIESHPANWNYGLTAEDVAALLEGSAKPRPMFWRSLISGQIDADRMDYLLRDAHHIGVRYGIYDLERLLATLTVAPPSGNDTARLAITEGGIHAAESLVLARYYMFTQVYYHKTRVAYDILLREVLRTLLPGGHFPPPTPAEIEQYLKWDDWKLLGLVAAGQAGEAGQRVLERRHYREIYHTPEVATNADIERLQAEKMRLAGLIVAEEHASKSWYKSGKNDILVITADGPHPLSELSSVVAGIRGINQVHLYVRPEDVDSARQIPHDKENP